MTTKNIGQSHPHIRITKLANVVLRMVIITARSLHTALVVTLALSRSGSHCIRLVLTSLPPASLQGQLLRHDNLKWILVETLQSTCIWRQGMCLSGLTLTQYAPLPTLHSLAALCRSQLVLPGLAHSVDSSLTRECLPLTIFRTGAGVNQSGPEYSGPSNQSSESWADSQLEIVSACQCDEHFRFERNFPYS